MPAGPQQNPAISSQQTQTFAIRSAQSGAGANPILPLRAIVRPVITSIHIDIGANGTAT